MSTSFPLVYRFSFMAFTTAIGITPEQLHPGRLPSSMVLQESV